MATKPAATANPAAAAPAVGDEGAPPTSRKKLLLIVLGVLLLVGAGVGGWLFWQHRQAEAVKTAAAAPPPPLIYLALDPPFVANFEDGQAARFLQVDLRISSRSQETIDLIRGNDPLLRNDLLMLFSAQDAAELGSRAGKDRLRAEALATVRRIVKDLRGDPKSVESVLFASFVMQ
jgi:flagellar FliL protein